LGTSSLDIVRQFGGATARVAVRWRIYDKETGKEIFHKTVKQKNGEWYRLFWRNPAGKVLPVLTLDDQNHRNLPVGEQGSGTAFGVSEQGFLLTNRHIAAAWKTPWREMFSDGENVELWDCQNKNKKGACPVIVTTIDDARLGEVREWVPETGSPLYDAKNFHYIDGLVSNNASTRQGNFYGRNDSLLITFANTRLEMNATLVRVSDENDVALIKVESPSAINIVKTADNASPAPGEKVVVLGYPAIALKTYATTTKFVDQQLKNNVTEVPQPYVTEGIVATVPTNRTANKDGVVTFGPEGDTFQLTINSTGPGNSGGPVFNSNGEVIGIFARAYKSGFGSSSGAVPIRSGLELMR
jgi:S1-C subfamily serine protease